ncbi:MAG: hypothetical protein QNK23_09210 [Crocinitomicaceae bacterium]|nr:hypothetical protein [Crocinitomicaceae bacterium]
MKITLNILLLFVLFQSTAQNLVPNPSFEDFSTCPTSWGSLGLANSWTVPVILLTPDYFNTCALPISTVSPPNNFPGYSWPATGEGFVGLLTFGANSYGREFIESELISPLTAGETYEISFKYSCADSMNYSVGALGIYLSTSYESWNIYQLSVTPQIEATSSLSDTSDWITFSQNYIAQGGEKFITLGNFRTDSLTIVDTINNYPGSNHEYSYHYIDDVSIVSTIGIEENQSSSKNELIKIIDTLGRETEDKPNTLLIYIYSDGTIEKVFRVE